MITHNKILRAAALALLCAATSPAFAGTRIERTINDGWSFRFDGQTDSVTVNIPHSWNATDCTDDTPGFRRGATWYSRTVRINDNLDGRRVYVRFEGAYQTADLYVNGHHAGRHDGGFTAFIFDVTSLVRQGDNAFRIRLDNSHNPDIPPLNADFTFFGGIYRDVSVLITPAGHISTTHYASQGVYVSTPSVSDELAEVKVETHLTLEPGASYGLRQTVISPSGETVATAFARSLKGADVKIQTLKVPNPVRWDVDSPELYTLVTALTDRKGRTLDEVHSSFGIRTFRFDCETGFHLNGRHLKLIGTNRHQDYKEMANAVPDEMHVRDVRLLKDMGGNFLRISHYPQDPIVTQMTDRLGILASVEIPIIDEITLSPAFRQNCVQMMLEMVYQNYNSPSVVVWTYMNEVMIRDPWKNRSKGLTKEQYNAGLCATARAIDEATKAADPLRPTMIPIHDAAPKYKESGLMEIPDIVGINLYCGWYKPGLDRFGPTLQAAHELFAGKPLMLTEYGADEDARLHSESPESFDYTTDYGFIFHQAHIPVILSTGYLAGATVWNLADFHSEIRGFAVPHINLKGLTGLTRIPKDTYWLYKAHFGGRPFTMIRDHDWQIRGGAQNAPDGICTQTVGVISTAPEVTLRHNGRTLGTGRTEGCVATFEVPFTDGENILEAAGSDGSQDFLRTDFRLTPSDLSQCIELNVMLGSRRIFEDRKGGVLWLPEQEYKPGSWGYVGGKPLRPSISGGRTRPAMEGNVLGTDIDPVFQTQRVGIEEFRADFPDGQYYVYLYLAETTVSANGFKIPYVLGEETAVTKTEKRVFDVSLNGTTVLKDFDMAAEYGPNRAIILKFATEAVGGEGINLRFTPVEDLPMVAAVRIYRRY